MGKHKIFVSLVMAAILTNLGTVQSALTQYIIENGSQSQYCRYIPNTTAATAQSSTTLADNAIIFNFEPASDNAKKDSQKDKNAGGRDNPDSLKNRENITNREERDSREGRDNPDSRPDSREERGNRDNRESNEVIIDMVSYPGN